MLIGNDIPRDGTGSLTVKFSLARGPLDPNEQAKFLIDLARITSSPVNEITIMGQVAPDDEGFYPTDTQTIVKVMMPTTVAANLFERLKHLEANYAG